MNHLMYADDLVVFCPDSAGLQELLNICSQYGLENDIKYNATKSSIMIVRMKDDKNLTFPEFTLCGSVLNLTNHLNTLVTVSSVTSLMTGTYKESSANCMVNLIC